MSGNNTTNAESSDKAAALAVPGAHVAPEKATSKKGTRKKKSPPKAKKSAKSAPHTKQANARKKAAKPARKAPAPRAESKGAKILEMIARTNGATLAEIMKAADWQAH